MKKLIPLLLLCPPLMAAELNPNVTQDNTKQTVCVKGWTSTVRPPVSYTNRIKHNLLPKGRSMQEYELDHIVPLALGGHPSSKANLMLQPWGGKCGARTKDKEEYSYYRAVCRGEISLENARKHFMPWKCE